jgi:hypothetical protein
MARTLEGSEYPANFHPISLETPIMQQEVLDVVYHRLTTFSHHENPLYDPPEFVTMMQNLRTLAKDLIISLGDQARLSDESIVEMGIEGLVSEERLRELTDVNVSQSNFISKQAAKLLAKATDQK